MKECKHQNLLRVDVNLQWCPDCDGNFYLMQCSVNFVPSEGEEVKLVNERHKKPAPQTCLEILQEFYDGCKRATAICGISFDSLVDLKCAVCRDKLLSGVSTDNLSPVESELFKCYMAISAACESKLFVAIRTRLALDECARKLAEIDRKEAQEKEQKRTRIEMLKELCKINEDIISLGDDGFRTAMLLVRSALGEHKRAQKDVEREKEPVGKYTSGGNTCVDCARWIPQRNNDRAGRCRTNVSSLTGEFAQTPHWGSCSEHKQK